MSHWYESLHESRASQIPLCGRARGVRHCEAEGVSQESPVAQAMLRIAKGADEVCAAQARVRMSHFAGLDWKKKLEATLKPV